MGLFKTYSERQIKKMSRTLERIESLADKYRNMTNEELSGTTALLKKRLADGETLDDILPDAFAAIREADDRILGKRPFRVQLIGGIVLHQGRIAEMKTGEGKTLVATLPAYLNALSGEGVHIVTVNEYLARRDSEEMGRVFAFMGLSTGLVVQGMKIEARQAAYNADITYGTNNEFGFDYLRDNMMPSRKFVSQRGHAFAIVDEVDSVLIDEARTPLIISGSAEEEASDMYDRANDLAKRMRKLVIKEMDTKQSYDDVDADYIVDEKAKNAILTPNGVKKAEEFFGIETLSDRENAEIAHHVNLAIRAHGTMKRDVDYVVNKDGVKIVDDFTGRILHGRRYSDGLHQAIEAKEGVKVEKENRTLATITFQNYFRLYKKLSGMTGTALTEEAEFNEIYNVDVIEIPTNRPMIRIDHPDIAYRNIEQKYDAVVRQIIACHEKGQPVLVGTVSIDKSEELSERLKQEGIVHNVLNAKIHDKEAEIVAQAGKLGAVTISTNMAGRGTDIMLGGNPEHMAKTEMRKMGFDEDLIADANGCTETDDEDVIEARETFRELYGKYKEEIAPEADKVREAGGLFILGTERHESRRVDNQLRGRSGRQGDPGESRFFISFEDDLPRLFGSIGSGMMSGMMGKMAFLDDGPIDYKFFSSLIETAQKKVEARNFQLRKNVISYDAVMNQQRNVIYKQRNDVLMGENVSDTVRKMILSTIDSAIERYLGGDEVENYDYVGLREHYKGILFENNDLSPEELSALSKSEINEMLCDRAMTLYESKEKLLGSEAFREIERRILLDSVDDSWMEHIDAMDDLKDSLRFQSYAQRDPVTEYRIIGAEMFDAMVDDIKERTARIILALTVTKANKKKEHGGKQTKYICHFAGDGKAKKQAPIVKDKNEPDRNAPCPCGSGKKYKKCCGISNR